MSTRATYICCDGPGSYGYEGHECQRKGCRHHVRQLHGEPNADGVINGACTQPRCSCPGFEELP